MTNGCENGQPRVDFADGGHNTAYAIAFGFWQAYENGEVPEESRVRPGVATRVLEAALAPEVVSPEVATQISRLALEDIRQIDNSYPSDLAS